MASFLNGFACCQGRHDKFSEPLTTEERDTQEESARAPEPEPEVAQSATECLTGPLAETLRLAEARLPFGRMSQWQRDWCTPKEVARYLNGRHGDPVAASVILAQALTWREEHQAVLSGAREPRWQTDLRVLTCGERGHPIIYGCFRHNVRATADTVPHIIDHMVAVMEAAAVEARRRGVKEADLIFDCHGFRMADNLNPAPLLALMRMANQPYRDGLRAAYLVDAPLAFQFLWNAARPLLCEKTRGKIHFVSREEAVRMIVKTGGPKAAADVDHVMGLNRGPEGCKGTRFPSELPQEAQAEQPSLRRKVTRRLTRALTHFLPHATPAEDAGTAPRPSVLRALCCRRRRVPASPEQAKPRCVSFGGDCAGAGAAHSAPSTVVRAAVQAEGAAAGLGLDECQAETLRLAAELLPGGQLTNWQRDWCTPRNVDRYLRGRNGNPAAAAHILAEALQWREEYKEVLSGARVPNWQTDLRVLTRSDGGHPIIYGCFRHNVRATAQTIPHIVDQMVAVMEAAAKEARRNGVQEADNILDCHGYRMADNLNPAPMLALMRMANQPYRDCLRTAYVVDAPFAFQFLWKAAAPLLSEKTRRKICFLSKEEAIKMIAELNGTKAAQDVDRAMCLNRTPEGCQAHTLPSEIPPEDEEYDREVPDQPFFGRKLTRQLTRAISNMLPADKRTWGVPDWAARMASN